MVIVFRIVPGRDGLLDLSSESAPGKLRELMYKSAIVRSSSPNEKHINFDMTQRPDAFEQSNLRKIWDMELRIG